MISFTEDDFNLDRIINRDIRKYDMFDMGDYHIFGLKTIDRPHVRILIDEEDRRSNQLKEIFTHSGYSLEIYPDPDSSNISIGLRRDIRKNVSLSRKLIKMVILSFEGKLVWDKKKKFNLGKIEKKQAKKKEKKEKVPKLDLGEINGTGNDSYPAIMAFKASTISTESLTRYESTLTFLDDYIYQAELNLQREQRTR